MAAAKDATAAEDAAAKAKAAAKKAEAAKTEAAKKKLAKAGATKKNAAANKRAKPKGKGGKKAKATHTKKAKATHTLKEPRQAPWVSAEFAQVLRGAMDKIFEIAVDEKTWSVPVLLLPVFESRLFLDPTAYSAKGPYITDNNIVIADFLAALGYQVAGLPDQPALDGDGSDSGKGNIPAVVANGSVIAELGDGNVTTAFPDSTAARQDFTKAIKTAFTRLCPITEDGLHVGAGKAALTASDLNPGNASSFPPQSTLAHHGLQAEKATAAAEAADAAEVPERTPNKRVTVAVGGQLALIGLCCLDAALGTEMGRAMAKTYDLTVVPPPAPVGDELLRFFVRPSGCAGNRCLLETLLYFAASRAAPARATFSVEDSKGLFRRLLSRNGGNDDGDPLGGLGLPEGLEGLELGPGEVRAAVPDVGTYAPFFEAVHEKLAAQMTGLLTTACNDVGLLREAFVTVIDAVLLSGLPLSATAEEEGVVSPSNLDGAAGLLADMQRRRAPQYKGVPAAADDDDDDDDKEKCEWLELRRDLLAKEYLEPTILAPLFLAMFFPVDADVEIRPCIAASALPEISQDEVNPAVLCSLQPRGGFSYVPNWVECSPFNRGYSAAGSGSGSGSDTVILRVLTGEYADMLPAAGGDARTCNHYEALVPWHASNEARSAGSALYSKLLSEHACLGDIDCQAMMAAEILHRSGRKVSEHLATKGAKYVGAYKKKLSDAVGHADGLSDGATVVEQCRVIREASSINKHGAMVATEMAAAAIGAATELAITKGGVVEAALQPYSASGTDIVPFPLSTTSVEADSAWKNPKYTNALRVAVAAANTSKASAPHIAQGNPEDRLKASAAATKTLTLAGASARVVPGLAIADDPARSGDDVRAYTALCHAVLHDPEGLAAVRVLQNEGSGEAAAEAAAVTVADATLRLLLKSIGPFLVLEGERAVLSAGRLRKCIEGVARARSNGRGQHRKKIDAAVSPSNILDGPRARKSPKRSAGAETAPATAPGRARKRACKKRKATSAAADEMPLAVICCRSSRRTAMLEYLADWGPKYGPEKELAEAVKIGDQYNVEKDPVPRYIWTDKECAYWGLVKGLPTFEQCAELLDDDDAPIVDLRAASKRKTSTAGASAPGAKRARPEADAGPVRVDDDGVHDGWGVRGAVALDFNDPQALERALKDILSAGPDGVAGVVQALQGATGASDGDEDDDELGLGLDCLDGNEDEDSDEY